MLAIACSINVCSSGKVGSKPQSDDAHSSSREAVGEYTQSFYGKWEITKVLGRSNISALNEEEVREQIGKQKEYFASMAVSGNVVVINPVYRITSMNIVEFENGERVNAKKIGIESDTVRRVKIDSSLGRSDFGVFYIKDKDTLIYPIEGCWFEMKRQKAKQEDGVIKT